MSVIESVCWEDELVVDIICFSKKEILKYTRIGDINEDNSFTGNVLVRGVAGVL